MSLERDGTYEIRAHTAANRLYIVLTGRLGDAEIAVAADMAVASADRLDSGFDVITVISGFQPSSLEAAAPMQEAHESLSSIGIGRVVRVADSETNAVVLEAFERRSREAGYEGRIANSVTEAERMLE